MGAGVIIIAIDGDRGHANAAAAYVIGGTGVAVAARSGVGNVFAADLGITEVIGAWIKVVTYQSRCPHALAQVTIVAEGAYILIVARYRVQRKDAPRLRVAGVVGTEIVIFAFQQTIEDALSTDARIAQCTRIPIVAVKGHSGECALPVHTGILGADVLIVADQIDTCNTLSVDALVAHGAKVTILTGPDEEVVETTIVGIAGIGCAGVIVIAIEHPRRHALPVNAMVVGGAGIPIVAGNIQIVVFAFASVAQIGSTRILVITIHQQAGHAFAITASVIEGTGIAIVARSRHGEIETATQGRAGVLCAGIGVIAILQRPGHTLTSLASIPQGTGVTVVTFTWNRCVLAAGPCVAAIGGTIVGIIANYQVAPDTFTINTSVCRCTSVPVIAGKLVIRVDTALLGVTEVLGAGIVIGTVGAAALATFACCAHFAQGASIAIVTGEAVVRVDNLTRTIVGIADRLQTEGTGPQRLGTLDHGTHHHFAVVGEVVGGAHQRAVAGIAILQ